METGILLQKIENSAHQAKYLIAHFSDAPAEVTRIENIIYNNLQKNYSQDILPINSSFSTNSKELIMLPMNKEANVSLLTELRKRAWISFSPIYNSQVILSREYINTLKTNTRIIRDKELSEITNLLVRINLLSEDKKKEKLPKDILLQITNWRDSLKETQKTINDYINIQPEPGRSQLEKINNEIIPILESCETNYTVVKNIIDKPKSEPSKQPRPEPPKPTPNPLKKGSYSLEVKVKDEKGGVITGSRSGTYPVGSSIELKAVPSPGYRFVSWTEDEKVVCQTTTYSFQMHDRPMQLIAHFEAEQDSAWDLLWIRMVHFGAAIPKKVLLAIAAVIALILLLIFFYPSNTPQEGEEGTYKEGKKDTQAQIANGGILSSDSSQPSPEEKGIGSLEDCNPEKLSKYGNIQNTNNLDTIKEYIDEARRLKNNGCTSIEDQYITPAKECAEKIVEEELKKLYKTDKKIERIKSYDAVKKKIDDYKSALDFIDFNAYKETYRSTTIKFYENEIKVGKWENKDKDKFANYIKTVLEDPNNEIAKNVKDYYKKECSIYYPNGKLWTTVEELLEQLKTDIKGKDKPYDFVINGCNTIINSKCATTEQKKEAKKLKENAENLKKKAKIDTGNIDLPK